MHIIFQATTSTLLTPSIWGLAPALKHLPYAGLLLHSNNMIFGGLLPSLHHATYHEIIIRIWKCMKNAHNSSCM